MVNGSKKNLKITDKEDLNIFESLTKGKTHFGIGFDIHKLIKGRKLFLGGVKIPLIISQGIMYILSSSLNTRKSFINLVIFFMCCPILIDNYGPHTQG